MGFLFIRKTASMGSSSTGALVAAGSLQPVEGQGQVGKITPTKKKDGLCSILVNADARSG